jgi:uncharacterized protein (DUF1501 family)
MSRRRSTPATPSLGPTRRRFLQGMAVAGGAVSVLPSFLAKAAGAGSPIAAGDGMVVVVTLRGGNDALNTLAPTTTSLRGIYDALRGTLSLATSSLLPITSSWGLNGQLPKLAARFARGQVSLVQGVGMPTPDLSHFRSMDTVMAGTATDDRTTGWLGRYLDEADGWDTGLSGLTIQNAPHLLLSGRRAKVPVLSGAGGLWGTSTEPYDKIAQDAVRAMAANPTGLGPLADLAAATNIEAMAAAAPINPLYATTLPTQPLTRDLTLAARALNADAGTRCVSVELNGFDTHAVQGPTQAMLLQQVDAGVEAFWNTLSPTLADRVVMVVVSEFGRRPTVNGSLGTDHGTAGMAMLVGPSVKGGITGVQPSLSNLDADGNLVTTVDIRSVYATVLAGWLGADDTDVLGATYPQLDLFRHSAAAAA